jgi:hypothetical protein
MENELFALYQRVAGLGRPCMVGGSVAAMLYGEPRATLDIDMVLDASAIHVEAIMAAFPAETFYIPPEAVIRHELSRGAQGMFNILDHASCLKLDIYPAGNDQLIEWGLENRRTILMAGHAMMVAPPAYIITMKLRYLAMSGQDKHLRDIAAMLRVCPAAELDRSMVSMWADRYGVRSAWDRLIEQLA